MTKKVYRSLFDSDDVYEVEQLTDTPDISTAGVAKVADAEPTLQNILDAINGLRDAIRGKVVDNEPGEGNKVVNPNLEVDGTKAVNDGGEKSGEGEAVAVEGEKAESDEEGKEASKEVKDSYSGFANSGKTVVKDHVGKTQIAFQNRYAKVANK